MDLFKMEVIKEKLTRATEPFCYPLGIFFLSTLFVSTAQWFMIQFLATYCSPWGWAGPITNIFSLGSPVCSFTNHVQIVLADYYITIWAGAAGACIGSIHNIHSADRSGVARNCTTRQQAKGAGKGD